MSAEDEEAWGDWLEKGITAVIAQAIEPDTMKAAKLVQDGQVMVQQPVFTQTTESNPAYEEAQARKAAAEDAIKDAGLEYLKK